MRTLVLLRHAKAESHDLPDFGRHLAPRGHRDARAVGEHLLGAGIAPDVVLCSPATRTRETWGAVAAAGVGAGLVTEDRRIYGGYPEDLLDVIAEEGGDADVVLLVGHAPGVPMLAGWLADDASDPTAIAGLRAGFPTSGLAVLTYDGAWVDLTRDTATLTEVAAPRG